MTAAVSDHLATPGDEAALVQRCQQGDRQAFDQLVLANQQQVFAVALRMLGNRDEAEDVAQDVFVRAFRGIGAFRQQAKLSTWLVSITMNLCRNRRRWWARHRRVMVASLDDSVETSDGELSQQVADLSPLPDETAVRREQQRHVLAAVQQLDESSRSVVVLRDLQGYAYEEIAQVLHLPVGTVKSRLNRARLELRALVDGAI